MAFDYKKEYKEYYMPKAKPEIIEVPPMNYIAVRGAGDPLFADLAVRDAIDAGKYQGPRLVAPGTGVTVPGGHGAGLFAQVANSPAEAAEQVRDLYARGAGVIKLFVTGGVFDATEVGEPGVLRMPVEVAAAACKAAHEVGRS